MKDCVTLKTGISAFLLHCKVYKDRKVIWNVTILIIPHCYHIFMNTNNVRIKNGQYVTKNYFASPRQFFTPLLRKKTFYIFNFFVSGLVKKPRDNLCISRWAANLSLVKHFGISTETYGVRQRWQWRMLYGKHLEPRSS